MITAIGTGIVLGLSAGLSPGPLMALVIGHTLRHGTREGIKVALAPLMTDLPIVVAALLLLSRLSDMEPILGVITCSGGLLLVYLGTESFRKKPLDTDGFPVIYGSLFRGALVNALSPHPYLFWLTVGAPLVRDAWMRSSVGALGFLIGFYGCLVGSKILIACSLVATEGLINEHRRFVLMRLLGIVLWFYAVLLFWKGFELLL